MIFSCSFFKISRSSNPTSCPISMIVRILILSDSVSITVPPIISTNLPSFLLPFVICVIIVFTNPFRSISSSSDISSSPSTEKKNVLLFSTQHFPSCKPLLFLPLLGLKGNAGGTFGDRKPREPSKIKCLRLEGSNFRLGGIAPITRAVPSFRVPMRLAVSVAWQKGN